MFVIPVVDLMQGQVVRAIAGHRAAYRPVVSGLCVGSEPVAVARAMCAHCEATTLYVADLDALTGQAPQAGVLLALLQALPGVELWVDGGFRDAGDAEALRARLGGHAERVVPVFGSESLSAPHAWLSGGQAGTSPWRGGPILSLDQRGGKPLDAGGCWDAVSRWPERVIVMTLDRVGSAAGPDLHTLRQLRAKVPQAKVMGAGGIRDERDLDAARQAGAYAWLVASALHDGCLPRRPHRHV
jgi:phosphoribosyl isomerase A